MFLIVVLLIVVACDGLWWFAADRFVRQFKRPRPWRIGIALFGFAQLLGVAVVVAQRLLSRADVIEFDIPIFLQATLMMWHLIVLPASLIAYLLIGAGLGLEALARPRDVRPPTVEPGMSRRAFLGTAVAAPPALALVGAGVGLARQDAIRIRRFTVPVANLPAALEGFRIANVSDSHVGPFTNGPILQQLVEMTNSLDADAVCVMGDLINHDLDDLPAAAEMVRAFRARHGTYVVEGNHDLFSGRQAFRNGCERLGMDLLTNDTRTLRVGEARLQLLGLRWGGRAARSGEAQGDRSYQRGDQAIADSMADLDPKRDPSAVQVLLAHHPHAFDAARSRGIPLTLSGHSHGGQLMLPGGIGFGPLMYRYYSGHYRKDEAQGPCHSVVSNGCGNWFPLRVNAPAEIIEVKLTVARA